MKIYLWQDNQEIGPFTWSEIFVMQRRGEIDEQAQLRINDDPEFRSFEDWSFWREGNEVGPFDWDEIMLLLREGALDYEVQARLEGDPYLSSLAEVITGSNEVILVEEQELPAETTFPKLSRSVGTFWPPINPKRTALLAVSACIVTLLIMTIGREFSKQNSAEADIHKKSPSSAAPAATGGPLSEVSVSATAGVKPTEIANPTGGPDKSNATDEKITSVSANVAMALQTTDGNHEVDKATKAPLSDSKHPAAQAPAIISLVSGSKPSTTICPASPSQQTVQNTPQKPQTVAAAGAASIVPTIQDFFRVDSVKYLKKEPKDGIGIWIIPPSDKKPVPPSTFVPCLEASISAKENARTDKAVAKAYFFDENNKLIGFVFAAASGKATGPQYIMPVLLHKDKPERIFFPILKGTGEKPLKVVVVFGDKAEMKAACYPSGSNDFLLSYPEKKLVYDRTPKRIVRKAAIDPLVEYQVKTRNPKTPQITLFLRPPVGISDGSEIKGVIALSLLAGSLDEIKRQLQAEDMTGDYNGILGFANKHKLAILAWGSTSSLWNMANYSDVTSAKAKEVDKSFEMVADAWERGVKELGDRYGIPTKDFLLWGQCGSAHWAHAICLHKPDYFLAIDLHIPGYFEKPTPEAAKVLWCITTGENYSAYQNSLRFVADCKKLGYPMIYKAIVGLGHAGHPDATAMGFEFFEFALSMKDLRDQYDSKAKDALTVNSGREPKAMVPWPEIFKHPPFYGDIVNQVIYPADQVDMIPEGFRIPIPTKEIGAIWKRSDHLSSK